MKTKSNEKLKLFSPRWVKVQCSQTYLSRQGDPSRSNLRGVFKMMASNVLECINSKPQLNHSNQTSYNNSDQQSSSYVKLGSFKSPSVLNGVDMSPRSNLKKILLFAFGIALFCLLAKNAWAEVDPNLAIRAIIGEASSEGEIGMTAVAEAIRNRGTLKGVYGLKAKHVDREPEWVWKMARKAWEKSASTNLVKSADHWENTKDFGVPYWAKSMIKTAQVGKHSFYKVKP